jgi:CRP-like cAMP-binding protein
MLTEFSLSAELIDEFIESCLLVTYEEGSVLFLRDSPADFLFWISTGFAKLHCQRSDSARTIMLAGPGDFLGDTDFFDSKGRRGQAFEARALTKCSVVLFSRERVRKLLQKLDTPALIRLLERLNTRRSALVRRYATFLALPFRERLEMELRDLFARFGIREKRGTLLVPELRHDELAEIIGSSRPVVTRLIDEMMQDGILRCDDRHHFIVSRGSRLDIPKGAHSFKEPSGLDKQSSEGPKS